VTDSPKSGSRLRVAVAGSTGYAGGSCVDLLLGHPEVELVQVGSRSHPGQLHRNVYPGSSCDLILQPEVDAANCDVVVSALSPGQAARSAPAWLDQGATVIDISADFRLRDPALFRTWYGEVHPAPHLLPQAVMALPELAPEAIAGANLLALPGCFSTAAILACGPAAMTHLVEPEVVVDAKTGVSGAGRTAGEAFLYSELSESMTAYGVGGHRHLPEMEQTLTDLAGGRFAVTFVPHLAPMSRGIVATCYLRPLPGVTLGQLRSAYLERYDGQPFVTVGDRPTPSKLASYTNHCFLSLHQQGAHVIVCAVLDNLGRGASSQAIQVLNQRFQLDPMSGLKGGPKWP